MNVRVLYFASARDLATKADETISLPEGATVGDAADQIWRMHPGLKALRRSAKFSVNLVLSPDMEPLKEGDEVGVLPPVAGG